MINLSSLCFYYIEACGEFAESTSATMHLSNTGAYAHGKSKQKQTHKFENSLSYGLITSLKAELNLNVILK